jgi:hypothetical protein
MMDSDFGYTSHALLNMQKMGVTSAEVEEVLRNSQISYSQRDYPGNREMRQGERLSVVVDLDDRVVVTVLWRLQEVWVR